jgi:hypothetical protein
VSFSVSERRAEPVPSGPQNSGVLLRFFRSHHRPHLPCSERSRRVERCNAAEGEPYRVVAPYHAELVGFGRRGHEDAVVPLRQRHELDLGRVENCLVFDLPLQVLERDP